MRRTGPRSRASPGTMSISITPRLISKFQADGGKQTLAGLRVERSKQVREPVAMPKLIGSLWTGDDGDRCFDINIIHAVLAGSDCGCAKYKTGCFTQVQLDMGQRWADDILVMREKQRGRTGRNPNAAKSLSAAVCHIYAKLKPNRRVGRQMQARPVLLAKVGATCDYTTSISSPLPEGQKQKGGSPPKERGTCTRGTLSR